MSEALRNSVDAHVERTRNLAVDLFDALRKHTWKDGGICRDTYGEGEDWAHNLLSEAAKDIDLIVDTDAAANTYMTLPGRDRGSAPIVVGSHLDSVPYGGNYDGAAGVVSGLASLAALRAAGHTPSRDITVMCIRAEESVWFSTSYFGSRAALGTLDLAVLDTLRRYDTGRTLAQHISASGGDPAALRRGEYRLPPDRVHAFMEVHIEQGPVLESDDLPVGVVTGIRGNFRFSSAKIIGEYQHCGGMPRGHRQDAVVAAAMLIEALNRKWRDFENRGLDMAFTVGKLSTDHDQHALTKVPGYVEFSLDVRSLDPDLLLSLEDDLFSEIAEISQDTGVRFDVGPVTHASVGPVDPDIRDGLVAGAKELEIAHRLIGSGAAHDAAEFAAAGVPTGMIFIRNANGSHNPREHMAIDDFMEATRLLTWWLAKTSA